MSILHLCDQPPATVPVTASVADAIQTMLDRRVGAVAVVDGESRIAGMFTERDVLKRFALSGRDPRGTPVRELMTPHVELATTRTTAAEAFSSMVEFHYRHLPIVDDRGTVLGILSIRNLLQARIEELSQELESIEIAMSNDAPGG